MRACFAWQEESAILDFIFSAVGNFKNDQVPPTPLPSPLEAMAAEEPVTMAGLSASPAGEGRAHLSVVSKQRHRQFLEQNSYQ